MGGGAAFRARSFDFGTGVSGMAKVKIAIRLPPEHKAMLDRFDNPSGVARRFIAAGLAKANAPGTKEIEKLTEIREELRRIGVNLNQIARVLNGGAEAENIKEHLERLALLRERILRLLRYYYG